MKRNSKLISVKKMSMALERFQEAIDEQVKGVEIVTSNYYYISTINGKWYSVNLSTNKIDRIYNDPE